MFWHLANHLASLRCGDLAADIDLDCPSAGLAQVTYRDNPLTNVCPLQLVRGAADGAADDADADALTEHYVRRTDLVANYAETPDFPVSRQVYWRALDSDRGMPCGVELWISTQTELLDSQPALSCRTELPPCDLLQLARPHTARFVRRSMTGKQTATFSADSGAGLFLLRPADANWTYCQMIHPADFTQAKVHVLDRQRLRLTSTLFADEQLEKGVIRRARLCALFLTRRHDGPRAAEAYHRFVNSQLPLTT